MQSESNRKILGALVIGVALVAGAYTVATFTKPDLISPQVASVGSIGKAPPRIPLDVVDEDQNGIEDWQDDFVTTEPIIVEVTSGPYEPPTTLTGQTGVSFMQSILSSKLYAGIGRSTDEVIDDTVNLLERETSERLYDIPDIISIENYNDSTIKVYANTIASVIDTNNLDGYDSELYILNRIVNYDESERVAELAAMSKAYGAMRDGLLATPVPTELLKEHLDLINTIHAVSADIDAMSLVLEDPLASLMRMRRYEDNVRGLQYAFQNMYLALSAYSSLFGPEDPAVLFSSFAPERRN